MKQRRLFWNAAENRPRALWRLLGTALILIAVFVILSLLLGVALSLWASATGAEPLQPDLAGMLQSRGLRLANGLFELALVGIGVGAGAVYVDRRPLAGLGLHFGRDWWLDLGFGLGLGALLMGGIFLVERATGWLAVRDTFQTPNPEVSFFPAILLPVFTYLAVGIAEELLARGYLLQNLAEGFNLRQVGWRGALLSAWVVSSALFGLAHLGNPNGTLRSSGYLMVSGLLLGLGYVLSGELAIPIGLHITWNFFEGAVFGFPVSGLSPGTTFIAVVQQGPDAWTGGAFGPEAGFIGLLAAATGGLLTLVWVRLRRGRVALDESIAEPPSA
jgi:membrane protease YdiL (CAAX protease family)